MQRDSITVLRTCSMGVSQTHSIQYPSLTGDHLGKVGRVVPSFVLAFNRGLANVLYPRLHLFVPSTDLTTVMVQ